MTDNLASEYADSVRDSIKEKMTTYFDTEDNSVEEVDAHEALDEYPLEIVHQIGSPFEVVITVGGPDARIIHDMRWTDWCLDVFWGGHHAVRRSEHITAMGEYFLAMYEDQ